MKKLLYLLIFLSFFKSFNSIEDDYKSNGISHSQVKNNSICYECFETQNSDGSTKYSCQNCKGPAYSGLAIGNTGNGYSINCLYEPKIYNHNNKTYAKCCDPSGNCDKTCKCYYIGDTKTRHGSYCQSQMIPKKSKKSHDNLIIKFAENHKVCQVNAKNNAIPNCSLLRGKKIDGTVYTFEFDTMDC